MSIRDEILLHASDIINSSNMQKNKEYIQHGNISIYTHCMNVACMSLKISNKFNIKLSRKSLVRGALLHDYFLYDWHVKNDNRRLHGFTHAKTALKNANIEYELDEIEKDIIKKHMFPLNVALPKYKETFIVCIADKLCAIKEKFS